MVSSLSDILSILHSTSRSNDFIVQISIQVLNQRSESKDFDSTLFTIVPSIDLVHVQFYDCNTCTYTYTVVC